MIEEMDHRIIRLEEEAKALQLKVLELSTAMRTHTGLLKQLLEERTSNSEI